MEHSEGIFERGAAMNNGMCLGEAAEYYAKPCESNKDPSEYSKGPQILR